MIYDTIGQSYSTFRRADLRLQRTILETLDGTNRVVNVGAGAGSYEPSDRSVVAVEPSITMIRQRQRDCAPVVQATADNLPFPDDSFDAALAVLTLHHWNDWRKGVREMSRVAKTRVVILTYDATATGFWLVEDYFPEIRRLDQATMPAIEDLQKELCQVTVSTVPIPHDCTDGFLGAYWRRPHAYLDDNTRGAISAFSRLANEAEGLSRLQADLQSGLWQRRNKTLLSRDSIDLGYRLLVAAL
jgi:SAM-dependent methyltransferase